MPAGSVKKLKRVEVIVDVTDALYSTLVKQNIPPGGVPLPSDVPKTTYGASVAAWGRVLAKTVKKLHKIKDEYKVLHIDAGEVRKTHTKTLAFAVLLMSNEIIDGNKVSKTMAKAG